jgi:hypothetical protein
MAANDQPVSRRLRVFAFDPSLSAVLETSAIHQIVLEVPWEELEPGPVGEYVEVVDWDPASGCCYEPVDLDSRHLLAQDGLEPSESDPRFHQQMVYAVAMTTIRHFERALGRVAFWADRTTRDKKAGYVDQFVRRLRIYPHALRDRNAYYSPAKKALLFGYFPVTTKDAYNAPGTVVYTCLSHDIVAHEVTHALLDGVHPRFNEPTNPDVHAFHEAFADIVAMFQHFTYPSVLQDQIRRARGNLQSETLLSQLAQQFGRATARSAALRDALGSTDPKTGAWKIRQPDPHALESITSPHARGSILVAAVFRAFLSIYRARTADLFRIASGGTGLLEGELHPDLTRRLAAEAARCADRVLQMCIRAIDYCPPVDVTFGAFLRGVITADLDDSPEDPEGFRIVFVQSFREWGIHPRGVTSLGPTTLVWPSGGQLLQDLRLQSEDPGAKGREHLKTQFLSGVSEWNLESDRHQVWKKLDSAKARLHGWLYGGDSYGRHYARLFGLVVEDSEAPRTVYRTEHRPAIEVHSARPAIRRTRDGGQRTDVVVEITQRRRGYLDPEEQRKADAGAGPMKKGDRGDFTFRSGCTILIDPATQEIRRVIRTDGTIADDAALDRVRQYFTGEAAVTGNAFDAGLVLGRDGAGRDEPFALLHQEAEA